DFDRAKVMAVVGPLIKHAHPDVASAAIDAIGGRSPYRGEDMGWMATVGKGTLLARGHSTYEKGWDNPDARRWRASLIEVGDAGPTPAARAKAIRALGLVKDDAVRTALRKWSTDPAAEVRAA